MEPTDLAAHSTEWVVRLAQTCDNDSDRRWDAIRALQDRGDREVFDAAERLCASAEPRDRCLGANILSQGQSRTKTFHERSVTLLLRLLAREDDPGVLASVAMALGHRRDSRTIEPLAALRGHHDPDVRYGVVFGSLGEENERAVQTLIELSADEDSDVRDWATFGLGSHVSIDTPPLREALVQRLSDPDSNTREEAIVGLARRHDKRVVPALMEVIHAGWDGPLIREAVETLRDPAVLTALSGSIDGLSQEARTWAEALLADVR